MLKVKCRDQVIKCMVLLQIMAITKCANIAAEIEYLPDELMFETFSITQPLSFRIPLVDDINLVNVKFFAYLHENPERALIADKVIFDHMKKVVFYTHGFRTAHLDDSVAMKDAFFEGSDDFDCVVLVDWRKGTFANNSLFSMAPNYIHAATVNVPVVGEYLAEFINSHIPSYVYVYLAGHSLGAQISGIAGRTLTRNNPNRVIDRISDPAGPIFEHGAQFFDISTKYTLRKTDAKFVDVIHASSVLGMVKEAGHVDIYIDEVDCSFFDIVCAHSKAFDVFKASINKCSQIICPYNKFSDDNECNYESRKELSSLGILAHLYEGRGKYIARFYTKRDSFKQSTGVCTAYMNEELMAKDRICRTPPSLGSKCWLKPYESVCEDEKKMCKIVKEKLGFIRLRSRVTWVRYD
ncbi:phospholipase A1-like isoform X2 [Daktulosphaira vitifoliae]|uniref:phospholipase A1-like isoform X2 n=1 Tax=Daktulosphaira vitifoliae TaxID=58002 RepID=UPI0021AADF32|nr:phospholipase A1-like isoform X2 [Daktulosphaira vitifoliae]